MVTQKITQNDDDDGNITLSTGKSEDANAFIYGLSNTLSVGLNMR